MDISCGCFVSFYTELVDVIGRRQELGGGAGELLFVHHAKSISQSICQSIGQSIS